LAEHDIPQRSLFCQHVTVYTIHNLAYQGIFGYRVLEIAGIDDGAFSTIRKWPT